MNVKKFGICLYFGLQTQVYKRTKSEKKV